MANYGLPSHFPRLNYWSSLGFRWPFDANRPTVESINERRRARILEARLNGGLTCRVLWEINQSARAFLDQQLDWPTLLNYGYTYCDPRETINRSNPPVSSFEATQTFAKAELSKPIYRPRPRDAASPPLDYGYFNHDISFEDLSSPTAPPSICIGELAFNGRLILAYLDKAKDQFYCVPSDISDWGTPNPRPYARKEKMEICIYPPFTKISKAQLKEYISAYTRWTTDTSPASSNGSATEINENSPVETDESASPESSFLGQKFLFFEMH